MLKTGEQFQTVIAPGLAGWDVFNEAENLDDNASPDVKNAIYTGGFLAPRPGSKLFASKPSGVSGSPLQLMETQTSDGLEYVIAVYGGEFYLRQPLTDEWVKLNQNYTPTYTDLLYGYLTWQNGRGDDRLYACNGRDSFVRWDLCVTTVATAASAGASSITLTDSTRFPASGTVVIKAGGNEFTEAYTSNSNNVLTLTNTLDENIAEGDSVVLMMVEKSSMEKGTVLGRHQSRLFVCNRYGAETSGFYSVTNDPEDFTTGSAVTGASSFTIADGNGGITGIDDFGKFLLIEKEDSHHTFEIVVADDLASKLDKIQPVVSGTSVGPFSQESKIKSQNNIYYPTRTEGFLSLNPTGTGDSSSTGLQTISQRIQPYVTEKATLTYCRGTVYKQHLLWSTAIGDATENTVVLVYDLLRGAWSRWEGLAVKDWARANNNLYYMENATGDIYQCFTKSFNDQNNPYEVSVYTKRFNFGAPAQAKVQDSIYIQGYMTPATDLFIDVLFNEGGLLDKQTFRINKDTQNLIYSEPLTNAQGQFILGNPALGYVNLLEVGNLSFFRCYLGVDIAKGYFNTQLRMYSNKEAFWAITTIGFNPVLNETIDPHMFISPQ